MCFFCRWNFQFLAPPRQERTNTAVASRAVDSLSDTSVLPSVSNQLCQAPTMSSRDMLNPHNPEFLTKKPWYLTEDAAQPNEPTLDHQTRIQDTTTTSLTETDRLLEQQQQRKGKTALKKDDWVEAYRRNQPPYRMCKILAVRKRGSVRLVDVQFEDGSIEKGIPSQRIRVTGTGNRTNITTHSYDSKRDAYHGYNADAHNTLLAKRFAQREELRRQVKEQQKDGDPDEIANNNSSSSDDDDDNEFAQTDADAKVVTTRLARQGGVGGAQMKVTARNLRIREDTAKYLHNLDLESAHYDPKSRSMRDNPHHHTDKDTFVKGEYSGDNALRHSGDAGRMMQSFAWDEAQPSQAELHQRQNTAKKKTVSETHKRTVLAKYGGQEHLTGLQGLGSVVQGKAIDKGAALRYGVSTQLETKQQHNQKRQVAIPCKYQEDIFSNGHTAVWGSYFHKGAFGWGYADDHSLVRNSYGTGITGRMANDEAYALEYGTGVDGSAQLAQAQVLLLSQTTKQQEKVASNNVPVRRSKLYGEAENRDQELDATKVEQALQRAQEEQDTSKKRKKYHSLDAEVDMTEEDMEAYRLRKSRGDDPMAKINENELLEYKGK